MTRIIRRDAITAMAGSGAFAVLGLTGNAQATTESQAASTRDGAVLVQGTLTTKHGDGRRLTGFLETGILGGHVLCSLVRQDARNPAVQSIFAAPAENNGSLGVEVTVAFFTEPLGDVTFSLLHVCAAVHDPTVRTLAAKS